MRQIRAGVFETNSSSTHSITWEAPKLDYVLPELQSLKVLMIDKDMYYEQWKFKTPLEKMTLAFAYFNSDSFISRNDLEKYDSFAKPEDAFIRSLFNRMPELDAIMIKGCASTSDNAGKLDREFEKLTTEENWDEFLFNPSVCLY